MNKYILVRDEETIEVLEGREERRDRLIQAGYVWVNEPKAEKPKASKRADEQEANEE